MPGLTWTRGNVYSVNSTTPSRLTGSMISTTRPQTLVNSTGFYETVTPPTYAEYDVSQVIDVKDVAAHPVAGDGVTDDTASLQAILNSAAGKQLLYFPHGIYLLTDTLLIPVGSRLVGESFTEFSASGSKFKNAKQPTPMLKIGNAGDVGVAQLTDFIFTVADILPGAVLVEVNMAGGKPGNQSRDLHCCTNLCPLDIYFLVILGNSWAWVADHDLDGSSTQTPSPGGGFLVEAQRGTWLLGLGIEHHTLYQMNIVGAKNVFLGLQQGEAAYWQGAGATVLAPAPWTDSLLPSEPPDWSWCAATDAVCRMGLYQRVSNSSIINISSGGFWNFVSGPSRTFCATDCQDNAALYESSSKVFTYGISTINSKTLILESGVGGDKDVAEVVRTANSGAAHDGFPTGIMAAYLRMSG
ncbi:pectin lyase-like protein [Mollisia scopiformis]|uniref:Pectin lyase-like protein n=1 Tax=Mollisia scopiformis TaxID=149040 RepID=A0A132BCD7_MOLSC|nr:pectin lyase-like protein [Mollisia scopiformis]KUJ10056.1 pectin lyase-like protein [Mollisia scopiformis]